MNQNPNLNKDKKINKNMKNYYKVSKILVADMCIDQGHLKLNGSYKLNN